MKILFVAATTLLSGVALASQAQRPKLPPVEHPAHDRTVPLQTKDVAGAAEMWANMRPGRRLDLDFKDVDVARVLRIVAEFGHLKLEVAEGVAGQMSIRARNVTWQGALDIIAKVLKLSWRKEGATLRIWKVMP